MIDAIGGVSVDDPGIGGDGTDVARLIDVLDLERVTAGRRLVYETGLVAMAKPAASRFTLKISWLVGVRLSLPVKVNDADVH